MKIAVDARELQGRRTGVGRYLDELLRGFGEHRRAATHDFVLCSSAPLDLGPYAPLRTRAALAPGHGVLWEQVVLPRLLAREKPDLLFAPGYTAPLRASVPVVLVVHDVSFTSHPEWFSWREGVRRRTITRLAAARAARIVTVSQFSKNEIEAHLGISPGRIAVVPNGVTHMPAKAAKTPDGPPSILYVGSIFNRRNVPALIDAVAELNSRGFPVLLDIVGDNRTTPHVDLGEAARRASVADMVTVRAYVDDEELAHCYARASAFAFLSDYEGFGLTPLEALSAGVPIVVLDSRQTREVYGEAAIYVGSTRRREVATALERALFDRTERARVLTAAQSVLARYSWSRAADAMLGVFDEVGRNTAGSGSHS